MPQTEAELQAEVNKAIEDEAAPGADNEEIVTDDDDPENAGTPNSDDDPAAAGDPDAGDPADAPGDDEPAEEDEDDEDILDLYMPPAFAQAAQEEQFDIRNLPRDENGKIDPTKANEAIQEFVRKQQAAGNSSAEANANAEAIIVKQWQAGIKKFPHVHKNPKLLSIAKRLHFASLDTDRYVSPYAAMKEVNGIYTSSRKSATKEAKTRKRVESAVRTESGAGKQSQAPSGVAAKYAAAKKKAMSSDPQVAAEGRREALRIRRQARNAR